MSEHQETLESESTTTTSLSSDGCAVCFRFYDGKYCTLWRDIVPEEIQKTGCERLDHIPPFP